MSLIKFIDWLHLQDESTAKTRARNAVMMGLPSTEGPDIPDADKLGGHSTNPWYNKMKKGTTYGRKGKKPVHKKKATTTKKKVPPKKKG
jgi:hypothetical protein